MTIRALNYGCPFFAYTESVLYFVDLSSPTAAPSIVFGLGPTPTNLLIPQV